MNADQAAGRELEWCQPESFRRFYQLKFQGSEVGTLRFEKRYGSRATGAYGESKWTFKRTGFFSRNVSVRASGSETDIAMFTQGWTGGGSIAFNSGRRYRLRYKNLWGTRWAFEAEDRTAVVSLSGPRGLLKHRGTTTVAPFAANLPETPVMLLLIWYVRLLMNADG